MANVTTNARNDFRFGAVFTTLVASVKHTLAQRAEYTRVYNELVVLSQRELSDIGMTRGDVKTVAKRAAEMV